MDSGAIVSPKKQEMPGQQLVCLWQAIYARNPNSTVLTNNDVCRMMAKFSDLSCCNFSEEIFLETFPTDESFDFKSVKYYVDHTLRSQGVPASTMYDEIEGHCWKISREWYTPQVLNDRDIEKLWLIVNRLCLEGSYPPVVSQEVVAWLTDKVATSLGKIWLAEGNATLMTFPAILQCLETNFFSDSPPVEVSKCIDGLYTWMVKEVLKSAWMYKRTRKQANWTNWTKRWCVLTPGKITYYDKEKERGSSGKKGEILVTSHSIITSLPPYKGMMHKLDERFKINNVPYLEIEFACADKTTIKNAWLSAIKDVIECAKQGTTPVQRLLQRRKSWLSVDQDEQPQQEEVKVMVQKADENQLRVVKETEVKLGGAAPPRPAVANGQEKTAHDVTKTAHDITDGVLELDNKNMVEEVTQKIKAIFMQIDSDGNGKVDYEEFKTFIKTLGLTMDEKEIKIIWETADEDKSGYITLDEFSQYFTDTIMEEGALGLAETKLRGAFLAADRDGTGTLDFKEFAEYVWEKKRSIRVSKLVKAFSKMDGDEGLVSYDGFRNYCRNRLSSSLPEIIIEEDEEEDLDLFESPKQQGNTIEARMKSFYKATSGDQLATFIRERWEKFASFRRYGSSGELVMKGGSGMVADFVPGEYSLIDLACFSDLPPLVPKHAVIKGVEWLESEVPGKSGKLVFPSDFNEKLPTDLATSELLRYYDCSFAEGNQIKVSLLYRHGIQDFTYENKYLDDYVTKTNGGAGLERHEFSHLDCPLEENSGDFILAKLVGDDELHVTSFHVPNRHTLYIPGGVIHCNDYLKGTWRTMLSDEVDIDHVHLVKNKGTDYEHFVFTFT